MVDKSLPKVFKHLVLDGCIREQDILKTEDGFVLIYKSLSQILAEKDIVEFPNAEGQWRRCDRFFDDWFLYAVPKEKDHVYSLVKLREQEHDTEDGAPADGDTPGVTISFIAFDHAALLDCLAEPTSKNRRKLNGEINRVVAFRGQSHHRGLKGYFLDPRSQGSYLVADTYIKHIAALAEAGRVTLPDAYKALVQRSISYKGAKKWARLPSFIQQLNEKAEQAICDNRYLYIKDPKSPTPQEAAAILATHTGNTSVYSFAAEVEYHARYLTPWAKLKIPFFGRSIYDSAIRADMTVDDREFEGPAPFYQENARIVRRQYALHRRDRSQIE